MRPRIPNKHDKTNWKSAFAVPVIVLLINTSRRLPLRAIFRIIRPPSARNSASPRFSTGWGERGSHPREQIHRRGSLKTPVTSRNLNNRAGCRARASAVHYDRNSANPAAPATTKRGNYIIRHEISQDCSRTSPLVPTRPLARDIVPLAPVPTLLLTTRVIPRQGRGKRNSYCRYT